MKNRVRPNVYLGRVKGVLSTPNGIIIPTTLTLSAILIFLATLYKGITSNLLVNLGAGVVTIGFTVLLVDTLRSWHSERQFRGPRHNAVSKIRASNTGLLIALIAKHYAGDAAFASDLKEAGENANNGDMEAMSSLFVKYAKKLCNLKTSELLSNFSRSQLEGHVKHALETTQDSLEDIGKKYGFSFNHVDFNNDFAEMLNNLQGAIGCYSVYGLGSGTLQKIISSKSQPMTEDALIAIMIRAYLLSYTAFVDKYWDS